MGWWGLQPGEIGTPRRLPPKKKFSPQEHLNSLEAVLSNKTILDGMPKETIAELEKMREKLRKQLGIQ